VKHGYALRSDGTRTGFSGIFHHHEFGFGRGDFAFDGTERADDFGDLGVRGGIDAVGDKSVHPFPEERKMTGMLSAEKRDTEPHARNARFTDDRTPRGIESPSRVLGGISGGQFAVKPSRHAENV